MLLINYKNDLIKDCASSKRNAFLIFSDLSDSTLLSNLNETEYIDKCFSHIMCAYDVLSNKTVKLVKSIGDEVMLTQILVKGDNKLNLQQKMENIIAAATEFHKKLKGASIDVKIGIHYCKQVITGGLLTKQAAKYLPEKASLRSERKDKFKAHKGDIFGSQVSYGARMMSVAKKGQIVISEAAFELL